MSKQKIFISHITEEAQLAKALKKIIDTKFLNIFDVFVSSSDDCIKLGDNWMNTIKKSLENSNLIIVLCSPLSIVRPWINFEAGAGWLKNIPVIPLCHSGLIPSKLPSPMDSFQAGMLSNEKDIEKVFKKLSEISDITTPDYKDNDFFDITKNFEMKISNSLLIKDTNFLNGLISHQIMILKYCIYASTMEEKKLDEMNIFENNINEYTFNFNQIYNLFNFFRLGIKIHNPLPKIFQVFKETVDELKDNIKFILSYNSISIAKPLKDLLNEFLFLVIKVENWYCAIGLLKNKDIIESFKSSIKEEKSIPERKPNANLFNWFIDYYESLIEFKLWISKYENEVKKIIDKN